MKTFIATVATLLILTSTSFGWDKVEMNKQVDQTNFLIQGVGTIQAMKDGKPVEGTVPGIGSATLIDREHGILISVAHVAVMHDIKAIQLKELEKKTEEVDYNIPLASIAAAPRHDLAVFHIEEKLPEGTVAKLACNDPERGDEVFTSGNPEGNYGTVTRGYVTTRASMKVHGVIETKMMGLQSPVNHGSSGGAVYNNNGEVVGVISMMNNPVEGLFIPVSSVKKFLMVLHINPDQYTAQPCDKIVEPMKMKIVDPEEEALKKNKPTEEEKKPSEEHK